MQKLEATTSHNFKMSVKINHKNTRQVTAQIGNLKNIIYSTIRWNDLTSIIGIDRKIFK